MASTTAPIGDPPPQGASITNPTAPFTYRTDTRLRPQVSIDVRTIARTDSGAETEREWSFAVEDPTDDQVSATLAAYRAILGGYASPRDGMPSA